MSAATYDVIEQYKRVASGKKTFVFCLSIAHAKEMARAFNQANIPADFITSELTIFQRRLRLAQFVRPMGDVGATEVLCGIAALREDAARYGAYPEAVILLKPFAKAFMAEGIVKSTKPPHMVLDYGRNFSRLALTLPFTPRVFSPLPIGMNPPLAADFGAEANIKHELQQFESNRWMYRGQELRHYRTRAAGGQYRAEGMAPCVIAPTLESLIERVDAQLNAPVVGLDSIKLMREALKDAQQVLCELGSAITPRQLTALRKVSEALGRTS